MKKFKVTVTRIDEYEVEIDESIYCDSWAQDFRRYFWGVTSLEEIAEYLAQHQARFGEGDGFIEGFGHVLRDGKLPYCRADYTKAGKLLPADLRRVPVDGLNIITLSEEEQIETEVEEIQPTNANHEQVP